MGKWRKIKIGEFLFERQGKYKPDNEAISGLKRIDKIDFSGNFHIVQKPSKTNMIMICPGDLVISGINVSKGAMGIYSGDEDVTATIHYSSYTFDISIIEVEYFKRFLKSSEFIRLLKEQIKGGIKTEIKPKHILPLEIELPDIEEQRKITEHFKSIETEYKELKNEISHQKSLLKKLRQQILQEAIEGKLTADWRTQNKLSPCQGGVPQSGEGVCPKDIKSLNLNNLPHLKTFRKSLRKNLTPAEARLWTHLKAKKLKGRKFRRQHSIGNYILDFYCPSEKLAIELDGEAHNSYQAARYDEERDTFLNHTGIKVLRFENEIVFENPDGLLARVAEEFDNHPSAPSGYLPLSGEEYDPASELLKRIAAEKEQLVKDKKIKKQKPLPPISDEEKPFALPEGWVWCRLNEVIYENPRNGYSPKTVDFPTSTKSLKLGATTTGKFISSKIKYIDEKIPIDSFLWLKEKDILIQRGNSMDFVGVSAIYYGEENNFIYPDLMMKLKPVASVSEVYLHLILMSIYCREYFRKNATGAQKSMPKINQATVSNAIIPLCRKAEQKAIVAKVEKLLALCEQLESQISQNQTYAGQLMQAVLKEAFSANTRQASEPPDKQSEQATEFKDYEVL